VLGRRAAGAVRAGVLLRLGRVSNLPTVWTNALAGGVLATGAAPGPGVFLLAALSLTLTYEAGMWLNDAFDADIDRRARAERPIPKGEIARATVWAGGAAFMAGGLASAALLGPAALAASAALSALVLLYDWLHKRSPLATLLMGGARLMSYGLGAAAVGAISAPVLLGAAGLFAHVVGLSYAARQEAYDRLGAVWPLAALSVAPLIVLGLGGAQPVALALLAALAAAIAVALRRLFRRARGDVPRAVVTLIAAISLLDAALIAAAGQPALAAAAALGFGATLLAQRVASGT